MPIVVTLLLTATFAPLASFALLCAAGRQLGRTWAGLLSTTAVAVSFACAVAAMLAWLGGGGTAGQAWGAGQLPIVLSTHWADAAGGDGPHLTLGIYVDSLTVLLFGVVSQVALLVHIFSIGYMRKDPHAWRYFAFLGLFCASMLGLVLGGTLVTIFICWELVGLCSYLLIGFWHQRPAARAAAIKAFIVNRIGDTGLLIAIAVLVSRIGDGPLPRLWATLGPVAAGGPGPMSMGLLTTVGLLLLLGAIGKSAQFPLHVWLSDAMEGPSPVSALIHAATMVAAGVYLAARLFPILTPDARLTLAVVGAITIAIGALSALAQTDVKRVLAYSTISQLGYMMLALGISSWAGGLFHLVTHALFKALLFLAAGSVVVATGHEHALARFGGLIRRMPVTGLTFLVGVLAISGLPALSGFESKDWILSDAAAWAITAAHAGHHHIAPWLFFVIPAAAAWLTAFYMARCWALIFLGRPRNLRVYARAGEAPVLWLPLLVLAGLTIVAGYSWSPVRGMIESSRTEMQAACRLNGASLTALDSTWPGEPAATIEPTDIAAPSAAAAPAAETEAVSAEHSGAALAQKWTFWAFLGLLPGLLLYFAGPQAAAILLRWTSLAWLADWLRRGMGFDRLCNGIAAAMRSLAGATAEFDRTVVDGVVRLVAGITRIGATVAALADDYVLDGLIGGIGRLTGRFGGDAGALQSGRVRWYLAAVMAVLAVGAATVVTLAMLAAHRPV